MNPSDPPGDNIEPFPGGGQRLPAIEPDAYTTPAADGADLDVPGMATDAPRAGQPMPAWFMGLGVGIVLVLGGAGYVAYQVFSGQWGLPGTALSPASSAALPPSPPTPGDGTADTPASSPAHPETAAGSYRINLSPTVAVPTNSTVDLPPDTVPSVPAPTPGTPAAPMTAAIRPAAASLALPVAQSPAVETVPDTTSTHRQVGVRLQALEQVMAEQRAILDAVKQDLAALRQQLAATDNSVNALRARWVRTTMKTANTPPAPVAAKPVTAKPAPPARPRAVSSPAAVPFTPLSVRSLGDRVSVRVRATGRPPVQLRPGQAWLGWQLVSADPIARTAVFVHTPTATRREVLL